MNNLNDLNKELFTALERLNNANGEQLKTEIERSQAVSGVACQIINNFALQLKRDAMLGQAPRVSSEIIVPIEDLNKPRVQKDKNTYRSIKQ
jgi:hypothetical protein